MGQSKGVKTSSERKEPGLSVWSRGAKVQEPLPAVPEIGDHYEILRERSLDKERNVAYPDKDHSFLVREALAGWV
jgi:hypothetical protein